ncbi:hypothetical protein [Paracoccus alkanivorans]|uniref:Uncharacterized protein n=1 Tax=Paracoccus alkanivorans TaxID=2116655 RepID=A0A3M0MR10_9RHOB|nr:hypothetical protein [Paracoccus alkanivorans]RMC33757.1 hypothetical protein C9E81_15765 [Paracoccus alkanivorans]
MSDELKFWIVIVGAAVVKLLITKTQSVIQAVTSMAAAIFMAWVFTDPILSWLEWPAESYRNAVAAVLALLGDTLIRRLLEISKSPTAVADILKLFGGRK